MSFQVQVIHVHVCFCFFLLSFNHFVLILLHRGIPGQVRRLIDNMKKDAVSSTQCVV